MDTDKNMSEKKVQFGSGLNILDGWENTDLPNVDIRERLPYDDDSVDFILTEHCLEHVNSQQALQFMREAYRILKRDGILRICVPCPESVFGVPMPNRIDGNQMAWSRELIECHGHQMIFNRNIMEMMLKIVGFVKMEWTARKEIDGHWKVITAMSDDRETIRIEAIK